VTEAAFIVEHAGPLTSFQDEGRRGYMRYGVPASGPMDRLAFAACNAALDNRPGSTLIETAVGGVALRCVAGSVTAAVTGGDFIVVVDGEIAGPWTVRTVRSGSTIAVKPGFWGTWAYLGFAGSLQAGTWLGSQATHTISGLGGGGLARGQRIVVLDTEARPERVGDIAFPSIARPRHEIRVVLGPQDRFFAREVVERFSREPFVLTAEYDRMGVQLKGPSLPVAATLDMLSEPLVRGAVQVPGTGDPIVLLADHQTTGGYPKIATVVSADFDAFVQLRARQQVMFRLIGHDLAVGAARVRHRAITAYLESLTTAPRGPGRRLRR
jgi:biotin-dependent carboxylase-like uncharacterized protein